MANPGQQLESFKGMLGGEEGAAGRFFTGEPKGYLQKGSANVLPSEFDVSQRPSAEGFGVVRRPVSTVPKPADLSPAETQVGLNYNPTTVATSGVSNVTPVPTVSTTTAGRALVTPSLPKESFLGQRFTPFAPELSVADIYKANPQLVNPATQIPLPGAEKVALNMLKKVNPGILEKYGPAALIGAGGLYASGLLDTPEPEPDPDESMLPGFGQPVGSELYAQDPGKYKVAQLYSDEAAKRLGLNYNYNPNQTRLVPVAQAAKGGIMSFPRREALVRGPGTERSDDIPAMLSDGEFVMTSKAVRGASPNPTGNKEKDRQNGAKNMYAMMRNFEMRA